MITVMFMMSSKRSQSYTIPWLEHMYSDNDGNISNMKSIVSLFMTTEGEVI